MLIPFAVRGFVHSLHSHPALEILALTWADQALSRDDESTMLDIQKKVGGAIGTHGRMLSCVQMELVS